MTQQREKLIAAIMILAFLLMISAPYLYAINSPTEAQVFGGFLLNPIDGNSYLAKMRQGFEGRWLFTLPYTADPGAGAALNLCYMFLGHVSRFLGWSLIFTFHFARVLGALCLGFALYGLSHHIFSHPSSRLFALGLTLFGSGLGWIASGLGYFTSDFWVAEAYPFLSSFANAHFPLGVAMQVWLLTTLIQDRPATKLQSALIFAVSILLSVVFPFGWLVAVVVIGIWVIMGIIWKQADWRHGLPRLLWILLGGAPYIIYSLWVVKAHPVLSQWNAQNLTPAPSFVDLVVSFSPALLLAAWGLIVILRKIDTDQMHGAKMIAIWMLAGIIIIYLPVNLQRRLISGLYIPIAILAVFTWQQLKKSSLKTLSLLLIMLFSLPTNLLILSETVQAAGEKDSAIYVFGDELAAFRWLNENAPDDSLVMAAPDTGLLIPAYTLSRVLYGHPFETVAAEARITEVRSFYSGAMSAEAARNLLASEGVDYVLYGPREKVLAPLPMLNDWQIVFEQGEVQILARIK